MSHRSVNERVGHTGCYAGPYAVPSAAAAVAAVAVAADPCHSYHLAIIAIATPIGGLYVVDLLY